MFMKFKQLQKDRAQSPAMITKKKTPRRTQVEYISTFCLYIMEVCLNWLMCVNVQFLCFFT